jgi:hypothetical protein
MTSPRWDVRWHHEVRDLASLPAVRDLEGPPCMTGPAWLRWARRIRRPGSRQARADCCRYHRVNWHAVSEAAIRIALQAQASGTRPEAAAGAITPASCGLAGDDLEALGDLLTPEIGIEIDDDDPHDQHVYEGRHRITAMRDVGVRRTVILRSELIEAADDPQ